MSLISSLLLILVAGPAPQPASDGAPLRNCRVVDGDTLRCGHERIRLLGIDAPEMPGHCQKGRRCAPGDPFASRASLARAMAGRLTIERIGSDRYGRTLGLVRGPVGDLSCWQLRTRQARYRADWDDGSTLARRCREAR
ncbi:thermonuclease family protein [Sphingomonas sp. LM7]|uniref:thermonuclease family protein n=1 Tax=Sphingomonas sp. LM7 TaxID=1938607 RepID=UPI003459F8DA